MWKLNNEHTRGNPSFFTELINYLYKYQQFTEALIEKDQKLKLYISVNSMKNVQLELINTFKYESQLRYHSAIISVSRDAAIPKDPRRNIIHINLPNTFLHQMY